MMVSKASFIKESKVFELNVSGVSVLTYLGWYKVSVTTHRSLISVPYLSIHLLRHTKNVKISEGFSGRTPEGPL